MQRFTILTLTAIAGFVDTLTFVSAHGIFAAHVTGNFVVFGASLGRGIETHDYFKLASFPIFMLAVALGVWLFGTSRQRAWRLAEIKLVLALQASLFLMVAICALTLPASAVSWLALVLVAAMGLQNALHRYLPGPMTTVMTGSVMNWSAMWTERLFGLAPPQAKEGAGKPMTGAMIFAFALGCTAGGLTSPRFGLAACFLPGLLLAALILFAKRN